MDTTPTPDQSPSCADIRDWLLRSGLEGMSRDAMLEGYCDRLVAAGVPLARLHLAQRTLHPEYGSLGFNWHRGRGILREQYGHTNLPNERWARSTFYFMLEEGLDEFRERLFENGPRLSRFPLLEDLRASGATDYLALALGFTESLKIRPVDPVNPPEGMIVSWTGDAPGGFTGAHVALIRESLPALGLALKSVSNRQMAEDLVSVYLGPDAGRRVMSGEIMRGSLETIHAVVWYFDLKGFTRMAEARPGEDIVAMLNDYFGAVSRVIARHGGNILKFMGDGLLAIFSEGAGQEPARAAIDAANGLLADFSAVNARRSAAGLPVTDYCLAIHAGDLMYGNIGAEDRLDFTVIGPAVNAASRILGMCQPLEQQVLISSAALAGLETQRDDIVSLGRYMLRGIPVPQNLFTLLGAQPE